MQIQSLKKIRWDLYPWTTVYEKGLLRAVMVKRSMNRYRKMLLASAYFSQNWQGKVLQRRCCTLRGEKKIPKHFLIWNNGSVLVGASLDLVQKNEKQASKSEWRITLISHIWVFHFIFLSGVGWSREILLVRESGEERYCIGGHPRATDLCWLRKTKSKENYTYNAVP